VGVDHLELAGHFLQRHLDHLALFIAHHVAVLAVENQLAGLGAQAGGEDAVIGAGAAAALGVAGHGDADIEAALFLKLLGNFIGDGGILVVFQLLLILLLGELGVLLGDGALGHGQDGEAAAAVVARLDLLGNLVDVVGNFGDQN